jgi:hypothetical protein
MERRRIRSSERQAEAQRAREAQEEADSVLYRWYRPDAGGTGPIVGPAPKVRPGAPPAPARAAPPREARAAVSRTARTFDEFLERQGRRVRPPQTPPRPRQFFSVKSRRIASNSATRPAPRGRRAVPDECTFSPDRSPTQNFRVAGPPIEWVEPRIVMKGFKLAGLELEQSAIEAAECPFRPEGGDVERRDRLASRYVRTLQRQSQEKAQQEEEMAGDGRKKSHDRKNSDG